MTKEELKEFLDFKVEEYNSPAFVDTDPIQIPHKFSSKEDIEIIAFFMATIAWGNRKMIISNGEKLLNIMGNTPYDFVMNAKDDFILESQFVHRTFNSEDLLNFVVSMRKAYLSDNGLEGLFQYTDSLSMKERLIKFNRSFSSNFRTERSLKHVANPSKGSAAKRINMFLRWMVRKDQKGVDFGIWNSIPRSELHLPLDVHSGRVARKLGLLDRKQNDWKAVEELQRSVSSFDPEDPAKYDFALFGLGAFEGF